MKNVFLTAAIIASLGVASVATAQNQEPTPTQTPTEQTVDAYAKIEVSALPAAVTEAVAKAYEGSTIKEAYENKEAKLFKVVITVSEDKEETVIYNENGEVQKEQ